MALRDQLERTIRRHAMLAGGETVLVAVSGGGSRAAALGWVVLRELGKFRYSTSGTPRSHIGIVSREFQVPCVMGCTFTAEEPEAGREVELDCSGDEAVVRG